MSDRLELVDIALRRKSDRKFLCVTNRKHGGFTMPGGKIDETLDVADDEMTAHEKAALRELREETGLVAKLSNLRYVGYFEHKWRDIDVRCHGYYGWIDDLEGQEPKLVEKGTKPFWAERDALLDPESGCLAPAYYGWLMAKINWDHYADD